MDLVLVHIHWNLRLFEVTNVILACDRDKLMTSLPCYCHPKKPTSV